MTTGTSNPSGLEPWRTIWFSPRRTMHAVAAGPSPTWLPVYLVGVTGALFSTVNFCWFEPDCTGLDLVRFIALTLGTSGLMIGAAPILLTAYGRRWGGVATSNQVRAAIAWASAPAAVALWFWIPIWIANDGPINQDALDQVHPVALVLWLFIAVLDVWTAVILVATIAEVQSFSVWRSLDSVAVLCLLWVIAFVLTFAILNVVVPRPPAVPASPNARVFVTRPLKTCPSPGFARCAPRAASFDISTAASWCGFAAPREVFA